MKRTDLLDTLKVVGKSLSGKKSLPAFTAFFFEEGWVTGYNDEVSISARCPVSISGGISGKVLLAWLNALKGDEVEVQPQDSENTVVMRCGRSKMSFPVISLASQSFQRPADRGSLISDPDELVEAIAKVHPFLGQDRAHPWRLGATLCINDGVASVYASTNTGMGHAMASVDADRNTEAQLPSLFVELLESLGGAVVALEVGEGWVEATFEDDTTLFSRTLGGVRVSEFEVVLDTCWDGSGEGIQVPDGIVESLGRAEKIMRATGGGHIQLTVEGTRMVFSTGAGDAAKLGVLDDEFTCEEHSGVCVGLRPGPVGEALTFATHVLFDPRFILIRGTNYEAVVAVVERD